MDESKMKRITLLEMKLSAVSDCPEWMYNIQKRRENCNDQWPQKLILLRIETQWSRIVKVMTNV